MFSRRIQNFLGMLCFIALLLMGCNSKPSIDQQHSDIAKLPQAFPVIERLQLVEYGTGTNEFFHYKRGLFSKTGRTYFDGETRSKKTFPAFDAQADKDLTELEGAIAQTGVKVIRISGTRYDAKKKLIKAEFYLPSINAPLSYIYSSNYGNVPDATHGQQITPIDKNWYFMVDDWN